EMTDMHSPYTTLFRSRRRNSCASCCAINWNRRAHMTRCGHRSMARHQQNIIGAAMMCSDQGRIHEQVNTAWSGGHHPDGLQPDRDRKSTRLNSSHVKI